jgi:hypothetical protein
MQQVRTEDLLQRYREDGLIRVEWQSDYRCNLVFTDFYDARRILDNETYVRDLDVFRAKKHFPLRDDTKIDDESTYGTDFGPDLSIHCPDYLLSQRYHVGSQVPSNTGAVILDAFFIDQQTQEQKQVFSTTIWGPLYHHSPNPYLINGHLYLEPKNNFAFVRFQVFYDDEIIKSQTLTTDSDTIDLTYIDIPWEDRIDYCFVPTTDITDYWQTAIKTYVKDYTTQSDEVEDQTQATRRFLYKKHIFGTEHFLTNFYFTAFGEYNGEKSLQSNNNDKINRDLSVIATAGLKVHSDSMTEETIVQIPYVAEVHICNHPAEDVIFYQNEDNFKADIITLAADTEQLTFTFPRDTYRFEGQFHDCGVYRRNINGKKVTWDLVTSLAAVDDNGQSYGALQTLHFRLKVPEFQYFRDLSYRIQCPSGVTRSRNRNFISTKDLISLRYLPLDSQSLENHHHLYQSTIVFKPRENTNVIMIVFVVLLSLAILGGIFLALHWCGLFAYIHKLMVPQQEYVNADLRF